LPTRHESVHTGTVGPHNEPNIAHNETVGARNDPFGASTNKKSKPMQRAEHGGLRGEVKGDQL
jgi:hypothetical protein